jgi:hypothetical protein
VSHDPIITADDVVRTGACRDGVHAVIERAHKRGIRLPAAMPISVVLRLLTSHERAFALKAAQLDGDGDGSGYGSGYGSGDGSGDGDGYGYSDGYSDGYGSGSGSGYGSGYGDGDGYGDT